MGNLPETPDYNKSSVPGTIYFLTNNSKNCVFSPLIFRALSASQI
jgi:hypothetical protein